MKLRTRITSILLVCALVASMCFLWTACGEDPVKTVASLAITHAPTKVAYIEGEKFATAGMEVTAEYDDGTTAVVTEYDYSPSGALKVSDKKIVVTYEGKTAEQEITVAAKTVTKLEITTAPTKTKYVAGQKFDSAGMVIKATYDNGEVNGDFKDYTVVPQGGLTVGTGFVEIACGEAKVKQSITVEAKAVVSLAITAQPTKTTYVAGETFDPTGMIVTATYNDGSTAKITGYAYAPDGALATTDNKITVTYERKTVEQAITVEAKAVVLLAITAQPTKTTYVAGETFDPTGMIVTATYNDGSTAKITGYTYAPDGALATTNNKITVTYEGKTAEQAITVEAKAVVSLAITAQPTKTTYVAGETFDPTGMIVTAKYNDGSTAKITGYTYAPDGALATTDNKITVTYEGKTAEQAITVVEASITALEITTPPTKTNYVEGQRFDPAGMIVKAAYNNGTFDDNFTGYTVSPDRALVPTDTFVTLSFGDVSVDQAVSVEAKTVTAIEITTQPTKTEYAVGETFNTAGMVVTATYNDGTSSVVTEYACAPNGALAKTDDKITVTYAGMMAELTIKVVEKSVTALEITTPPTKTNYVEGQRFEPDGMIVKAVYNNGSFDDNFINYTVAPDRALATSDNYVTISYGSVSVEQSVTVAAKTVESIAITTKPDKLSYVEGQNFNKAGMIVTAAYNNGTKSAVTEYTYAPTGALTTANDKIIVEYEGKTAELSITVIAKAVAKLEIVAPPDKTVYAVGETFDNTGMVVKATYNDGDVVDDFKNYTFTPEGALKAGDTEIIVACGDITVKQAISVKQRFTATASAYKNLKKFSRWEDAQGNKVSDANPYTYVADTEQTLTAVYAEFIELTGENVSADKKTYATSNSSGWYQAAYLTEPLGRGMTVEATLERSQAANSEFVIGLSPSEYVTDMAAHGWIPSHNDFKNLFVPKYNLYQGANNNEAPATLTPNNASIDAAVNARIAYDDASVSPFADGGNTVKIRFTLGDTLKIYIDDQLFTASALPTDWTIGANEAYYLSIAANNCRSFTVTDFGAELTKFAITKAPDKTVYNTGDKFSAAGMVVTAEYGDGASEIVTDYTVTPAGALTTAGEQTITLTYKGRSAELTVLVGNALFGRIEAESFDDSTGDGSENHVKIEKGMGENGSDNLGWIGDGDWTVYKNVLFDKMPLEFTLSHAGDATPEIAVRLDDPVSGVELVKFNVAATGNYRQYMHTTKSITYTGAPITGLHDVYLCVNKGLNIDWFEFVGKNFVAIEPAEQLVGEGKSAEFTLTRSGGDMSDEITVVVKTEDGTAVADNNYVGLTETITFASGENTKKVSVATKLTDIAENDCYFTLMIESTSENACVGRGKAAKIIIKDQTSDLPGVIKATTYDTGGSSSLIRQDIGKETENVGGIQNGEHALYKNIWLGKTPSKIKLHRTGNIDDQPLVITIRLGGADGAVLTEFTAENVGNWSDYRTMEADITYAGDALFGTYDLYFVFNEARPNGNTAGLNLAWFEFI